MVSQSEIAVQARFDKNRKIEKDNAQLLHEFVDLLTNAKEYGKIRAKFGVGSKEEAWAFALVQKAVITIEKDLYGEV